MTSCLMEISHRANFKKLRFSIKQTRKFKYSVLKQAKLQVFAISLPLYLKLIFLGLKKKIDLPRSPHLCLGPCWLDQALMDCHVYDEVYFSGSFYMHIEFFAIRKCFEPLGNKQDMIT